MKRRIYKRICIWAVLFSLLLSVMIPVSATARTGINPGQKADLTLNYQYETTPLKGIRIHLYRIAEVSQTGEFKLTAMFSASSVVLNGLTSDDQWKAAAKTLADYVTANQISAILDAQTNNSGIAAFNNLETGLYLVLAEDLKTGRKTYSFSPQLLALPSLDNDGNWMYQVTAYPKSSMTEKPVPPTSGGGDPDDPTKPTNPNPTTAPGTTAPSETPTQPEYPTLPSLPPDVPYIPYNPGDPIPPNMRVVVVIDENGVPQAYLIDNEVPLGGLVKTGDNSKSTLLLMFTTLGALGALTFIIFVKRKDEEN